MDKLAQVAGIIKNNPYVVAFTGAGISVDSGIPAFRGGQGLWEKYDPEEYAHIQSFHANPGKVWVMLREMAEVIFNSGPSPAHNALYELEKKEYLKSVVTQNVDGLHQVAGNTDVIEYHGNHRWLVCSRCATKVALTHESINAQPYPRCESCGRALRPDVVFFGESIPMSAMFRASQEADRCKVMFIIGTSGVVFPAAQIPYEAKSKGAVIVEFNIESTPFTSSITDYFFDGAASEILPKLIELL